MIIGMTKAKIAITIDDELVRRAKLEVAAGRASSVSAYIEEAVAARAQADALDALLDELLAASGGPLTAQERAEADRVLR
jgi:hypothetical protein